MTPSTTAIHRRVERLRAGDDPTCIHRMTSGWAVLGESQFLRGYCLLLPDPVAPHLQAMEEEHRARFLADMAQLGDAVQSVTAALRINYAMFGNVEPALHAHVIPRYEDEPEALRVAHPWEYDWGAGPMFDGAKHAVLLAELRTKLG